MSNQYIEGDGIFIADLELISLIAVLLSFPQSSVLHVCCILPNEANAHKALPNGLKNGTIRINQEASRGSHEYIEASSRRRYPS